jgi:hypothetical protein
MKRLFTIVCIFSALTATAQIDSYQGIGSFLFLGDKIGESTADTARTTFETRRLVADGDTANSGTVGNIMGYWSFGPGGGSLFGWREDGGRNFNNSGVITIFGEEDSYGLQVSTEDEQVVLFARNDDADAGLNSFTVAPTNTVAKKVVEYETDLSGDYTARSLVDKAYVDGRSGVTGVTASTPLASSGGATPNLTIQTASGSQAGALSSTDWTTFNNKANGFTATDNQLLYSVSNTPTGNAAFTADPTNYLLTVTGNSAATNTAQNRLVLSTNSTGTPAIGLGSALLFQGESSTTENRDMARISSTWSTVTDAPRSAGLAFATVSSGGALTDRVFISHPGRVGIGQASPTYLLTNTNASVSDYASTVTSSNGFVWLLSSTTQYVGTFENTGAGGHGLSVTGGSTSTAKIFSTQSGTTQKMTVFGDGKIDMQWGRLFGSTTTQETNYFAANSTGTNVNVGIVPKGTGAIVADIPDATSAGGNARGQQALDLQFNRSAATQVASGTESAIVSGQQNTASGTRATAIGAFQSTASGQYAWVQGNANTASADYTSAIGNGALAADYGQEARSSGTLSAAGDAQVSRMVMRNGITGTGAADLFANGTNQRCRVPSGRAFNATVQVVATCKTVGNGSGISVGETFVGTYEVGIKNNGGETALVGTVQNLHTAQADTGMSTSAVAITADNTNDALTISFTPPSTAGSTTVINVVATVTYTQVGF